MRAQAGSLPISLKVTVHMFVCEIQIVKFKASQIYQHRDVNISDLINRHTYTYGTLEGIGVCIGVPAKRGQTQKRNGGHS